MQHVPCIEHVSLRLLMQCFRFHIGCPTGLACKSWTCESTNKIEHGWCCKWQLKFSVNAKYEGLWLTGLKIAEKDQKQETGVLLPFMSLYLSLVRSEHWSMARQRYHKQRHPGDWDAAEVKLCRMLVEGVNEQAWHVWMRSIWDTSVYYQFHGYEMGAMSTWGQKYDH
jgi:hypothetical protein